MDTYIYEEVLLEKLVLLSFTVLFLFFMFADKLKCFRDKHKKPSEFEKRKLKKLGKFAYKHYLENGFSKFQAKKITKEYLKEVYETNQLTEKYDLIRRA